MGERWEEELEKWRLRTPPLREGLWNDVLSRQPSPRPVRSKSTLAIVFPAALVVALIATLVVVLEHRQPFHVPTSDGPSVVCDSKSSRGLLTCDEAIRQASTELPVGGAPAEVRARLVHLEPRTDATVSWIVTFTDLPVPVRRPPYGCAQGSWILTIDAKVGSVLAVNSRESSSAACPDAGSSYWGACPNTTGLIQSPADSETRTEAINLVRQYLAADRVRKPNLEHWWRLADPWWRLENGWSEPADVGDDLGGMETSDAFYSFTMGGVYGILHRNGSLSPAQNKAFLLSRVSIHLPDCDPKDVARLTHGLLWVGFSYPNCDCTSPGYAFVARRGSGLRVFGVS